MSDTTWPELSDIPVIDNHCHLFNVDYTRHELCELLNMSLNEMPPEQTRQTMVYRRMLKELKKLLGEQGNDEAVLAAREERMRSDYRSWVRQLFADSNLTGLLIDLGYKPAQASLSDFETLVPADVHYIFRLESILDDLWTELAGGLIRLEQAEEVFYRRLDEALADPRTVALKSIIGYRTGLAVENPSRSDIGRNSPDEKAFRDYFLIGSLKRAAGAGKPVQIHAAFGESNVDVRANNPAHLKGLLENPESAGARIVIVHGGYPYCFEAGFFASIYPNVYVDISEFIPFTTLGARRGLELIFDMCPFNKILFGSDGYIIPEIHWLGAKMGKELLAGLLSDLTGRGLFDKAYALQIARMVLFENARELYGL